MSHEFMTYHGPCISPVPTFHGSSPLATSSQITMCCLLRHISSETDLNGNSSLCCFKNCWDVSLNDVQVAKNPISFFEQGIVQSSFQSWIDEHAGVDEDPDHFVAKERNRSGELSVCRHPDEKQKCWSRLPRRVGVTGVLSLLRTVVVSVIMAMTEVKALAGRSGAVSEGDSYSCSWLAVYALFKVAALVIATKVDFDLYLLHISLALMISDAAIRSWPRGAARFCFVL